MICVLIGFANNYRRSPTKNDDSIQKLVSRDPDDSRFYLQPRKGKGYAGRR